LFALYYLWGLVVFKYIKTERRESGPSRRRRSALTLALAVALRAVAIVVPYYIGSTRVLFELGHEAPPGR